MDTRIEAYMKQIPVLAEAAAGKRSVLGERQGVPGEPAGGKSSV